MAKVAKNPKAKPAALSSPKFSRPVLIIFALIFATIGGYAIYRSFAAGGTILGDTNSDGQVSLTDLTNLLANWHTNNVNCDFNSDGTVDGIDLSILLTHYGQTAAQQLPAIPTGLIATPGDGSVTLSWNANSSSEQVDTYQVYDDVNGPDNLSVSGTSYTVTGLTNGATYNFRVSAHNGAGYSPWSVTAVSATPQAAGGDTGGVTPPAAPSAYTVPAGATVVSNSSQLTTALNNGVANIALADGTYANATYFTDAGGSNIYAQHLGGAVLAAGIVLGGNGAGGNTIQGLAFNLTNNSLGYSGAELYLWGSTGASARILDDTFEGNWDMDTGLADYAPNGLIAQRLAISHFHAYGLLAYNNNTVVYNSPTDIINTITDVSIDGVQAATPGSSNGTAEAGLWVGQPVTNGVQRLKIKNVYWSGLETVNDSWNTTFSNFNIDETGMAYGTGIYMEHFNYHNTFTNFIITGANTGINGEWDDPAWGSVAGAHFTTIQNGTIDATGATNSGHNVGIFLDEGTESTTITGVSFKNQSWAAIGTYSNTGTNNITGNTYQLAPGALQISTSHI